MFKVGERLSINNELCTIKYIGEIKNWPGEETYGLEWDNTSRGKHSGTIDGIEYFSVRIPGSASFMRGTKLLREHQPPRTFDQALRVKYGDDLNDIGELKFGSKTVIGYGFESLTEKNKLFSKLQFVSLRKLQISDQTLTEKDLQIIEYHCSSIISLDISFNLITDISFTIKLLHRLKNLDSINISGNKLNKGWENISNITLNKVKHVTMQNCEIKSENLTNIFRSFPNLIKLDISNNPLNEFKLNNVIFPQSLEELHLSGCLLTDIPLSLCKTNIKILNISNNLIKSFNDTLLPSVFHLNISDNGLIEWDLIDMINVKFNNLTSLNIQRNPIFKANPENFQDFYQLIARFDNLTALDGSDFDLLTRKEAELFFISKVSSGEILINENLQRYKTLVKLYNCSKREKSDSISWLSDQIMELRLTFENSSHFDTRVTTLANCSIRYLKSVICSKHKLNVLETELYLISDLGSMENLHREFVQLSDYGIRNNDIIHVGTRELDFS
ncbi:hypothetical protein TPHA_0I02240 [Tetrapisispora phaffii CBS 4417]|uniref:CAP-Gly domain-containing protein n=1 Tax=Tetrapisispora phaffii (strain ATCC 24235 / CBS 4417 / NBRC 1672 / NRRL Y-8282 / UCD 70-5) TaxID=1071381 RepID=G8BXV0_TETPH|nr:hypothetical protein TPHA_0I02240 [Tetrapisispora phaffii CBS 4417]CCE64728.1 hypothetical protein TPHA_0I02240 [Tetrapisispora phaffii CBS 4417]